MRSPVEYKVDVKLYRKTMRGRRTFTEPLFDFCGGEALGWGNVPYPSLVRIEPPCRGHRLAPIVSPLSFPLSYLDPLPILSPLPLFLHSRSLVPMVPFRFYESVRNRSLPWSEFRPQNAITMVFVWSFDGSQSPSCSHSALRRAFFAIVYLHPFLFTGVYFR
jgi:hypothetical protein